MRRPAAFFPTFLLTIGALVLASAGGARADAREGPIEIKTCQVIDQPGSYVLANNLVNNLPGGNCLRITADFVTIDLNGFLMSGGGGRNNFGSSRHRGA